MFKGKSLKTLVATAVMLVAFPVAALAVATYTMVGNYIITGSLQIDSLAPGGCVTASSAGLLSATGSACGGGGGSMVTTYKNGVLLAGQHTEVAQVTASGSTPWEATYTFGAPYTTAPICTSTSLSSVPNSTVAHIVSESTTSVTLFDSSHSGATLNVHCTGF